jgi:sterol desaturase/sphingolipid hydroxylase (fatty acid hydroxylase superfamily)
VEQILSYFETIPSLHRSILLVGGLSLFWILEGALPLFNLNYKKWRHALPNLFFTGTTIIINFSLAFLLLKSADWVVEHQFGILYWLPEMPLWLFALSGVFLMDLIGAYLPHFLEHKIKPLWMIHLVHHSDHNVDTTTANRHHPLESVVRYFFTLVGVFVIGAPIAIVMLYQSMSLVATQFSHANIKLPKTLDLALSYIIISPDMHKTHHHYKLPHTDTNFGNIFSVWDRLFGTYSYLERENLIYGVDTFPDAKSNGNLKSLLKQPFQPYRKPTTDTEGNPI